MIAADGVNRIPIRRFKDNMAALQQVCRHFQGLHIFNDMGAKSKLAVCRFIRNGLPGKIRIQRQTKLPLNPGLQLHMPYRMFIQRYGIRFSIERTLYTVCQNSQFFRIKHEPALLRYASVSGQHASIVQQPLLHLFYMKPVNLIGTA